MPDEECTEVIIKYRMRMHKWGRINRVAFDVEKEHIVILYPLQDDGDPFKLLGLPRGL